ncbi:MAG: sulfite exporter TauE/SafE family protein [Erysipelotrichaceae bacterium]|nr:sulfite exporter TauE/SafE family protein [Erysipelotrichaceae bacterium]MDP3305639.1 sulfite exporter TauE/SafE family protein [Erysipelotrichaceae bacterium]
MEKILIQVEGMTCKACEKNVNTEIKKISSVKHVFSNAKTGEVSIQSTSPVSYVHLKKAIEEAGYRLKDEKPSVVMDWIWLTGVVSVVVIAQLIYQRLLPPQIDTETIALPLVAVYGLITSFHCVSMCGGIALSQSMAKIQGKTPYQSTFLYNFGRIASYTGFGILLGGVGSFFSISPLMRNLILLAGGLLMLYYGISLMGWVSMPKIPSIMPRVNNKKISEGFRPLIVGILNGFMPCASLQMMQLYALASGSMISGGLIMLVFALTTAPVLVTIGLLSSKLNLKSSRRVKLVSAAVVVLIGSQMAFRSMSALNIPLPFINSQENLRLAPVVDGVQMITLTVDWNGYQLDYTAVQKGIPVQITVNPVSLSGCSNPITIPAFDIEIDGLSTQLSAIFTPVKTGKIRIQCWMNMISTNLKVLDN